MLLILLTAVAIASASDWKAQLQYPPWQDVLSKGIMHQGSGRTKRLVQEDGGHVQTPQEPCQLPNGDLGVCRQWKYCMQEDFKDNYNKYHDYLCSLDIWDDKKIGFCCPEKKSKETGLAGDLPAIAPKDEYNEALLKISRAENRGCGISTRPHNPVTDTRAAVPREWPWMASVTIKGVVQYCGGVLITERHVLTAAHCVQGWEADDLLVRLGEYNLKRDDDSRSYAFQVVEIRMHEDFQFSTNKNDIAILKLNRPAVFNTYVWPICLPPPGLAIVNDTAVLIGWGTEWYGGPRSPKLMETSVPIWDLQHCRSYLNEPVFDENICASSYTGGKDACQGDSGGPLMYQTSSGRWTVIGVVAWGVRCGEPNHPGIYTRVEAYLTWIMENARA